MRVMKFINKITSESRLEITNVSNARNFNQF